MADSVVRRLALSTMSCIGESGIRTGDEAHDDYNLFEGKEVAGIC